MFCLFELEDPSRKRKSVVYYMFLRYIIQYLPWWNKPRVCLSGCLEVQDITVGAQLVRVEGTNTNHMGPFVNIFAVFL